MMTRTMKFLVAAAVAFAALATTAVAQDWPTKPIRLINPNAPGGATDKISRLYAEKLSEKLGTPVIVENIEGATGAIGSRTLAESAPDGYTLMWCSITNLAMVPHIRSAGYDPLTQMELVARPVDLLVGLGVPASLGVNSVEEFVELAKSRPGELNFASAGVGSTSHLRGEVFNKMAGTDIVHVPYDGGGPAMVDLLAGRVQALFDPTVLAQQENGIKVLAIIGGAAHPKYPDIPLITAVFPDYDLPGWQGIFAPKGTDPAILAKVRTAIDEINDSDGIGDALLPVNAQPLHDDPGRDMSADLAGASALLKELVDELQLADK